MQAISIEQLINSFIIAVHTTLMSIEHYRPFGGKTRHPFTERQESKNSDELSNNSLILTLI